MASPGGGASLCATHSAARLRAAASLRAASAAPGLHAPGFPFRLRASCGASGLCAAGACRLFPAAGAAARAGRLRAAGATGAAMAAAGAAAGGLPNTLAFPGR